MSTGQWLVLDLINPEPWRIGPVGVRNPTQGNPRAYVGQDQQLKAFQEAVASAVRDVAIKIDGEIHLKFFFWRRLDSYEGATRRITKHEVDATNMQKATEDALQGILLENDRLVKKVSSEIIEQGVSVTPRIVIFAESYTGFDPDQIPGFVWDQIDNSVPLADDNEWTGPQ